MYNIGIDPGKSTGVGVYDTKERKLIAVHTYLIHKALELVLYHHNSGTLKCVIIEDARLATYQRNSIKNLAKLQGAGSIKRDSTIWEDYCKDKDIPYRLVRPNKNLNKFCENAKAWTKNTKWIGRTSHHARIAAMLAH
jgi:hypothetical protein